jgi:hypothetical protein
MKTKDQKLADTREKFLCGIINGIAKHNTNVLKKTK